MIASSKLKIRDYADEHKIEVAESIVIYLQALMGVMETDEKEKDVHYVVLMEFITETLCNYTFEEIKVAFKNFLRGDYEIKRFNKLDCGIVGNVMKAYDTQKVFAMQQQRIQLQKEVLAQPSVVTTSQNDTATVQGIQIAWAEVNRTGEMQGNRAYLYPILYEWGFLPTDNETKNAIVKIAKAKIKIKKHSKSKKMSKDAILDGILRKKEPLSGRLKSECRNITITRWLASFTTIEQLNNKLNTL